MGTRKSHKSHQSHHIGEKSSSLYMYDRDQDTLKIKPKALDIVWGRDERFWKFSPEEGGNAELLQVNWLEVSGQIDLNNFLNKGKEYTLKFIMELRPDNFGWGDFPLYFMVRLGNEKRLWSRVYLKDKKTCENFEAPMDSRLTFRVPERSGSGGGGGGGSGSDKLAFGMYEIWNRRWKGGLVIHEVIISPSSASRA